jgi:hypothetical protein
MDDGRRPVHAGRVGHSDRGEEERPKTGSNRPDRMEGVAWRDDGIVQAIDAQYG